LDGGSDYLLFASVGVNHVSSDNIRLDGRSDRIAGNWAAASIDNKIPAGIPAPGKYITNQTSTSSSVSSSVPIVSSSSRSSSTSKSSAAVSSSGCSNYINVDWNQRVELTLTATSCVRFNRNLGGASVQFWDSDINKSCDYRGTVNSIDGSGNLAINSNYVETSSLTGTLLKFTKAAGSSCNFIKVRAY